MICAIHQPNFFPWLGYFHKMSKVDKFVFLDNVNYEKSGHSMQSITNRVSILNSYGEKQYVLCPVIREHGFQLIKDVKINNGSDWKGNLLKTINESYKNAPYYCTLVELLEYSFSVNTDSLSTLNQQIIKYIAQHLGLKVDFLRQSDMKTARHSTELLVEICHSIGCKEYLYGKGGSNYQDNGYFVNNHIVPVAQNFKQLPYKQGAFEFVEGLSIIDAIAWLGYEGTKELLKDSSTYV